MGVYEASLGGSRTFSEKTKPKCQIGLAFSGLSLRKWYQSRDWPLDEIALCAHAGGW